MDGHSAAGGGVKSRHRDVLGPGFGHVGSMEKGLAWGADDFVVTKSSDDPLG
jgi:hypothetical protein